MKFTSDRLLVNEIYNKPTIQGEGRNLGKPCYFLRLAYCNLHCGFCDSKYSWDWQNYDIHHEVLDLSVRKVFDILYKQVEEQEGPRHLVITGGEPMLQFRAVAELYNLLDKCGWTLELETAGTIKLPWDIFDQYNVSPKLANSGNYLPHRFKLEALQSFPRYFGKTSFKFVIAEATDLLEVDAIVETVGVMPQYVYLMPEGITPEAIQQGLDKLIPLAIKRGYNVTPRLHILQWGAKRGV